MKIRQISALVLAVVTASVTTYSGGAETISRAATMTPVSTVSSSPSKEKIGKASGAFLPNTGSIRNTSSALSPSLQYDSAV